MKKTVLIIMIPLLITGGTVTAQKKDSKDKSSESLLRNDRERLQRDRLELQSFQTHADRFNEAWENRNEAKLKNAKASLVSDMKREIRQGKDMVKQYKREIKAGSLPGNEESKDIGNSRRTDSPPVNNRKERQERKLSQRDKRENFRDLDRQRTNLRKQRSILKAFKNYDFRYDNDLPEVDRKRGLIRNFLNTMEEDIERTKRKIDRERRRR